MLRKITRSLSLLLCFFLLFEQSGFAQVAAQLDIAGHLSSLHNALTVDKFRPLHLRYLQYLPTENSFRLLLDKGTLKNPRTQELENTSKELLKFFFIGLSLPNESFWVNLRPDSPDNIIDDDLVQTDIGKILLESDLQLKRDTASFTSPETPEGKEYWDKLYKKAGELLGSENITIPTLTRPWIVPDEIIIRETADSAYIYKATLKVMLEQDYLKDSAVYNFKDERLKELNEYSSQLIRELIIPKLTKEINSSKRYAALRQVYYSLILAQWFKARFSDKDSNYSRIIDRKDLTNLAAKEEFSKETYFQAYQKSFKDGEYNFKTPVYTPLGQVIRSYFSGGISGIAPATIPAFGGVTATDPKTGAKITSAPAARGSTPNPNVIGVSIAATDNPGEVGGVKIEGDIVHRMAEGAQADVKGRPDEKRDDETVSEYVARLNAKYGQHVVIEVVPVPETLARKAREHGFKGDVGNGFGVGGKKGAKGYVCVLYDALEKDPSLLIHEITEALARGSEGIALAGAATGEAGKSRQVGVAAGASLPVGKAESKNRNMSRRRFVAGIAAWFLNRETRGDEISEEEIFKLIEQLDKAETREQAIKKLVAIGKTAVPALIKALRSGSDMSRTFAVEKVLSKIGKAAEPDLINALVDIDTRVRRYALELLRKTDWQPGTVQDSVFLLVAEENWEELRKLGSAAVGPLLVALESIGPGQGGYELRRSIIKVLSEIGDARLVNYFIKDADGDSIEKKYAAYGLVCFFFTLDINPEIKEKIVHHLRRYIEDLEDFDKLFNGEDREALEKISLRDAAMQRLIVNTVFRLGEMKKGDFAQLALIYGYSDFAQKTKDLNPASQFSLAKSMQLALRRFDAPFNDNNIQKALNFTLKIRQRYASRVILDASSRLLVVSHSEDMKYSRRAAKGYDLFDPETIVNFAKDLGVGKIDNVKMYDTVMTTPGGTTTRTGLEESKREVLQVIVGSGASDVLYFNAHGYPNYLWLKPISRDINKAEDKDIPEAISYREFANALLQRAKKHDGRLSDLTILFDQCYSADFAVRVLNHLIKALNSAEIRDLPFIIGASNRNAESIGAVFLESLKKSAKDKKLLVSHIYEAEDAAKRAEDFALFFPVSQEELQELKDSLEKEVDVKNRDRKGLLDPNLPAFDAGWLPEETGNKSQLADSDMQKQPSRLDSGLGAQPSISSTGTGDVNLAAGVQLKVAHGRVNAFINENLPKDLRDNPQNIRNYKEVENFGVRARVIPISGLFDTTGQFAHIGLGQVYGEPVIYVDSKYIDNYGVFDHELYEIAKWEAKRQELGLEPQQMRQWILDNYEEAKLLADQWHNEAPSLNELFRYARSNKLRKEFQLQHMHGTNGFALIGVLKSGGRVLPGRALRQEGILPLSGETGGLTGMNQKVVSTARFGAAKSGVIRYADLSSGRKKNIYPGGIRASYRVSPSTIDEQIKAEEANVEALNEVHSTYWAEAGAKRLVELHKLKELFANLSEEERAEIDFYTSIPVVLSGDGKEIPVNTTGGGTQGEAAVTELAVTLVATAKENVAQVRQLIDKFGRNDIKVVDFDTLGSDEKLSDALGIPNYVNESEETPTYESNDINLAAFPHKESVEFTQPEFYHGTSLYALYGAIMAKKRGAVQYRLWAGNEASRYNVPIFKTEYGAANHLISFVRANIYTALDYALKSSFGNFMTKDEWLQAVDGRIGTTEREIVDLANEYGEESDVITIAKGTMEQRRQLLAALERISEEEFNYIQSLRNVPIVIGASGDISQRKGFQFGGVLGEMPVENFVDFSTEVVEIHVSEEHVSTLRELLEQMGLADKIRIITDNRLYKLSEAQESVYKQLQKRCEMGQNWYRDKIFPAAAKVMRSGKDIDTLKKELKEAEEREKEMLDDKTERPTVSFEDAYKTEAYKIAIALLEAQQDGLGAPSTGFGESGNDVDVEFVESNVIRIGQKVTNRRSNQEGEIIEIEGNYYDAQRLIVKIRRFADGQEESVDAQDLEKEYELSPVSEDAQQQDREALTLLEQRVARESGKEIVPVSVTKTEEIVAVLGEGKVVAVNLRELAGVEDGYKEAGSLTENLAVAIMHKFVGEESDTDPLMEVLGNAFVHGNRANFDLPIFLNLRLNAQGKAERIEVYDAASRKINISALQATLRNGLFGAQRGNDLITTSPSVKRYIGPPDSFIKDESGRVIGNQVILEFRYPDNPGEGPLLPSAPSANDSGAVPSESNATGGTDGSQGLSSTPTSKTGGVDFRSLPIVTQAISNLRDSLGTVPLQSSGGGMSGTVPNLDKEWQEIERMAASGIAPSAERIKEYLQASCAKGDIEQDIDKVVLCISDILRQEEENYSETDPTLKDILIVLESASNEQELEEIFLGKTI